MIKIKSIENHLLQIQIHKKVNIMKTSKNLLKNHIQGTPIWTHRHLTWNWVVTNFYCLSNYVNH